MSTIYELALELARTHGWRNVTRTPLFALAKERGIVGEGTTEPNWCKNYLRGANSLSCIREKLRHGPDLPDGTPRGERSPAWRDVNKGLIFDKAYNLAVTQGRLMIPREQIASASGVSPATVTGLWGGMKTLRLAIVEKARAEGIERLVHQADAIGLT